MVIGRPRSCHCGECTKCKNADLNRRWWNSLTPEQRREKVARRDPEKVREQHRRKLAKRRQNNPLQRVKDRARKTAFDAVRRGDLVRLPCEVCGGAPTEAHHEDYSKPLEVAWLCRSCHQALHKARQFGIQDAA